LSWAEAFGATWISGVEDSGARVVGEAPVDHFVARLGQTVGHRGILRRRLRPIPAVKELIGEHDPE